MFTDGTMLWRFAAGRISLATRAFQFSAAAVAVAELATERSTLLDPLFHAAYFIILILALGGAVTTPLRRWQGIADAHAAAWFTVAVFALVGFIFLRAGIASLVRAAEALTVGMAILTIGRDGSVGNARHHLLLASASLMLLLFGWVHITEVDAIAGLVPAWFPGRGRVPFVTAGIMMAAGVGIWLPRIRGLSALLVAGMFISWLPLVHAGRLWARPTDASEWSFATMAITLSGCIVILLIRAPSDRDEHWKARAAA